MRIEERFETIVEAITGADPSRGATLETVFSRIHPAPQVLALGTTRFSDRGLSPTTSGTRALYCRFSWTGP